MLEEKLRAPSIGATYSEIRRRRAAALLLETFADASSLEALVACLSDSDVEVQTHCVGGLGLLGLEESIDPLVEHWSRLPQTGQEFRDERLVDALHWALVEITGQTRLGHDAGAWQDWWRRNRSYR
jgi:hypothetical protein